MADTRDFLIGVLVGTVVGAAAALLYAPAPGAETRHLIKEKTEEAKDKTARAAAEARERAARAVSETQARVDELKSQAQSRLGAAATQAHEILDKSLGTVERQKDAVLSAIEAGKAAYAEKAADLHTAASEPESAPAA